MIAITGVTGRVGGEVARALLAAGERVRAVVRDRRKGEEWAARGCEVALAEMENASALAKAFEGATGVFILPPPVFDPEPGYPEARRTIDVKAVPWVIRNRANATPTNASSKRQRSDYAVEASTASAWPS